MTVENQTYEVFVNGNDSATTFSFSPMVLPDSSAQLQVIKIDADDTETTLSEGSTATTYSVSVSSYPGTGSITYPASGGTPLATGARLRMKRVLTLEQQTDLENQGGYFPEIQEAQFDRSIMIDLQQQEELDRCVKVPAGDVTTTLATLQADLIALAAIAADITAVAAVDAEVALVAAVDGETAIVAGISANVTTVAGISANVTTVAGISANVTTVAGISADVTTVAGVSADVSAVAAIASALPVGLKYDFATSTTMGDPGAGTVRFNNAAVASTTAIALDALTADAIDASDYIAAWGASTSTVKGYIIVRKANAPATFAVFSIDAAVTDNTGWLQITVTHIASAGALSAADDLYFSFVRTGDLGATGATGATGSIPIAAGAGTVNAITADFTPNTTLDDNALVCVVSAGANTSTTPTFTPDGLTTKTIKTRGGAALRAGDIGAAGETMLLRRDAGAADCWELLNPLHVDIPPGSNGNVLTSNGTEWTSATPAASGLAAADQADMETGTSISVASTPGLQQHHPGHPKVWGQVKGTTTPVLTTSYNVTSIADTGTGTLTITMATDFSSADYAVLASHVQSNSASVANRRTLGVDTKAAGTVMLVCTTLGTPSGPVDPATADPTAGYDFAMFGDQA